jgi:DNA topoisomerase-3
MQVDFNWSRNHLFEKQAVEDIYQRCRANPEATVTNVISKQTRKFKPSPLTTVELQKSAGRLLRMSPKRVLDVAEKLYQRGILSYPRTETNQYDKDFDFHTLISKQTNDEAWGAFATRLEDSSAQAFEKPVNGAKNDQAHPPIHPTKYANDLAADEKKVYEYVTRRFLASCSKHAVGRQTTVELNIAGEIFSASGVVVVERNYLEVYTYDKWGGPALPEYNQGERFRPKKMEMKEGETTRPKLLTEADLVSLMDRNGIGTDATIAEHISKIVERDYVKMLKEGQINYLIPSELGMGLVEGYNAIEFDGNKSLCKPLLRRETEERMNLICQGTKTRQETVQQSLQEYKAVFDKAKQDISKLIERVNANLRGDYAQGEGGGALAGDNELGDDDATVREDEDGDDDYSGGGGGSSSRQARAGPSVNRRAPPQEVVLIDEDSAEEQAIVIPGPRNRARQASTLPVAAIASNATARRRPHDESDYDSAPQRRTNGGSSSSPCFTCGEIGHWSSDCPSKNSNNNNYSSNNNNSHNNSDQGCFKCGKTGHWANSCNEPNQSGPSAKRARGGASNSTRGASRSNTRGRGRGSRR